MWVMGTTARPSRSRPADLAFIVLVSLAGCLIGLVYVVAAVFVGHHHRVSCGDLALIVTYHGGQASGGSELTAVLIGGALYGWTLFAAVRWPPRTQLRILFARFAVSYVVALAVLWAVAPHVWGPRVWTC
jgi:hypothetical protein